MQNVALDLLFLISQEFTEAMLVFAPLLRSLLDYLEDFTMTQVKKYFEIMCHLGSSVRTNYCGVNVLIDWFH